MEEREEQENKQDQKQKHDEGIPLGRSSISQANQKRRQRDAD